MFNEDTPTYFPPCPRIVVIGDVHGDLGRLTECLYSLNIINHNGEWIAEPKNTMVVQLGDQVDSISRGGTDDWEKVPDVEVVYFMDKLDKVARLNGGRVISLIGNHEFMNTLGDFTYVSEKSKDPLRSRRFAPGGSIAQVLAKRCVVIKIGSILFAHGGVLPTHLQLVNQNIHLINNVMRKYMRKQQLENDEINIYNNIIANDSGILWTRMYMDHANNPEVLAIVVDNVLQATSTKMICIGHNTVEKISPVLGGRVWFVDAALSRSYGRPSCQVLEIFDDGENFRISDIST
jgi:hypothetical protein